MLGTMYIPFGFGDKIELNEIRLYEMLLDEYTTTRL